MEKKKCNKCKQEKLVSEFYFRKNLKTNYGSICKLCENISRAKYLEKNKDRVKIVSKNWKDNNKEKIKEYNKFYKTINKEQIKAQGKSYRDLNKEAVRKRDREYKKKRINTDPLYKLSKRIRNMISRSFSQKNLKKSDNTLKVLGCSFEEFKIHIESLWESWMNWNNYGVYIVNEQTWQIDHIIPISSAKTKKDVIRLNHFSNLRPLCSKENNLKSNN